MSAARRTRVGLLAVGATCLACALVVTLFGDRRTTVTEVADGVSYTTTTGGGLAWLPVALAAMGLLLVVAAAVTRRRDTPS